jgi:hypothetical protein
VLTNSAVARIFLSNDFRDICFFVPVGSPKVIRYESLETTLEEEYGMTTPQRFRRSVTVLLLASAMIFATVAAEAKVHYVTQKGGAGTKDGESWTTAYDEASFPAAIISAEAGDEIRVKAGVYRPVIPANPASVTGANREKTSSSRTAWQSTADSRGTTRRAPTEPDCERHGFDGGSRERR